LPAWLSGYTIRKNQKTLHFLPDFIENIAMNIYKQAACKENKLLNIIFGYTAIGILIAATLTLRFHTISWQIGLVYGSQV